MENDTQTFVSLMLQHQRSLRAFIHSLSPQSQTIDDVLQNTNMVLWEKRQTFEVGSNFRAWAFKIARYQLYQQRSRDIRDGKLVFSDELIDMIAESAATDEVSDARIQALERCLDKLTSEQRRIVDARYSRANSLERLAENLSCTPGSLRVALYRIRGMLKRCVQQAVGGGAS